jgi:hypothetical protein
MPGDQRDARGFAGLETLGSDISSELSRAEEITRKTAPVSSSATEGAHPSHKLNASGTFPSASGTSFLTRRGKLIVGIAAVIGGIWFFTGFSGTYKTPSYAPVEELPPTGTGTTLSLNQIRYCLAEDIRIDGARSSVNQHLSTDVSRFNSMVADYNSRCGSFRYRSGTLESVRSEVDARRDRLRAEGARRFK